ncbi:MAG: cytochrome c [Burkholderiaceae bacterium]
MKNLSKSKVVLSGVVAAGFLAGAIALPGAYAHAQEKKGPHTSAIKARQGLMQIQGHSMGILGGMAKGNIPYDAKQASDAAYNLQLTSLVMQGAMWPKGSEKDAAGLTEKTSAKPEIWSTYPKITEKNKAFKEAADELVKVAGNGLDALKGGLGPVGKSCKGCHDDYKAK